MNKFDKPAGSKRPELVHRVPLFYGWLIMAAGTLGLIMTSPGQTYTVSIFIEHIIQDLGLSRLAVSALYTMGSLVGGLALPFWGRQIDRHGSRRMVTIIAVLFGLACIFMAFVQDAFMLGLGFAAIRMLGQGSLTLVSQNVMSQWWVRKRGMIMGLAGLFMAVLGMGAFPNLVHTLIGAFGWREAYGILGWMVLLIMAPIGFLLFRNQPEDYGLDPDGGQTARAVRSTIGSGPIEENWTLKEVMRTRVFWVLLISLSSFALFSTGQFFHMVSILSDRGLADSVAASVFVPVAAAMALGNLVSGLVVDRMPVRFLLMLALVFQALSLGMMQYISSPAGAFVFGAVLGTTNGIARTLSAVVWPSYYGRDHLASIYGFTGAAGAVGAALGPLPFGFIRDLFGTYQGVLLGSAAISLLLATWCVTVQKPRRPQAEYSCS